MSRPRAYRHHMRCSHRGSNWVMKDGRPRGKQTYRCRECHYRFTPEGNRIYYSERVKRDALSMYCEEMGISAMSRVMDVKLRTVYSWVKKSQSGGRDSEVGAQAAARARAQVIPFGEM